MTTKTKKIGRPTDYKPEYCDKIVEYFTQEPYREVIETYYYKNGESKDSVKLIANDLKFISGFAREIGVTTTTIHRWKEKYEEFSDALKKAKEIQQEHLVINGLQGNYQTAFAIFTAKNITDWRDNKDPLVDQSKHSTLIVKINKNDGKRDTVQPAYESAGDIRERK